VSDTSNQTALVIGAEFELGRRVWMLSTRVTTDSKEFEFKAIPRMDAVGQALTLQSVATELYEHFGGDKGALDTKNVPFPAIALNELTISGLGSTKPDSFSGVVFQINLDIGENGSAANDLQFTFASYSKGRDESSTRYRLAGVRTRKPISLGAAGDPDPVKRLLGAVALDRLSLFYASDDITGADVKRLGLFRVPGTDAPQDFAKGVSISSRFGIGAAYVDISLSSAGINLSMPGGAASKTPQSTSAAAATAAAQQQPKPKEGNRYWKELDKTLGPLQLRRIGGEWKNGKLGILLDAALELAALKVGLSGLAVRFEPSKLNSNFRLSDLEFGLDGLALDLKIPPIAISGALLRNEDQNRIVSYSGMASIRAASFTIAALGSFAMIKRDDRLEPSFFIYGAFLGVLGGPPCFVVEGIAAGFGYNRAIRLPSIEEVRNFPLVRLVLEPSSSTTIIERLSDSFPPTPGQYFVAAGVKFSSFKLISTFAVITVQFGTRFEIALLGVSTLQQPPREISETAFVVVEMALRVCFAPDDGLLSAMAVLTSRSFLFDTRCKLTGGFAFYIWFPPIGAGSDVVNRAGEFVLTMGGYHPRFAIPDHYPKVPRIGLNWSLPEYGVSIKGEVYFALTPSYIMAGGLLSAEFRSGGFHAWFFAYADFLIGWAPLYYTADVGVRIGASYTFSVGEITTVLSFEIGAELNVRGPPFGGTAYVNLGIVAFTVPIGDQSERKRDPLGWDGFAQHFLPLKDSNATPLNSAIVSGVVEEVKSEEGTIVATFVNAVDLRLSVESFIPVTFLDERPEWQEPIPEPAWMTDRQIGIRPMDVRALESRLSVGISRVTDDKIRTMVLGDFRARAVVKNMPQALWSPEEYRPSDFGYKPIENCLAGLELLPVIQPAPAAVAATVAIVPTAEITPKQRDQWIAEHEYGPDADMAPSEFDTVRSILADRAQARKAAIDSIPSALLDLRDFRDIGDKADHAVSLTAMPWQVHMGKLLHQAQRG
jgi:hypothetical protein